MASKHVERRRAAEAAPTSRPTRLAKPQILLVCEGRNTEPSYFNQLQAQFSRVRLVSIGEGFNRESLVKRALTLRQEGNYAEVWCVFDKDPDVVVPAGSFTEALQLAKAHDVRVAWSNEGFEYWLLLHFNAYQGEGLHRSQYNAALEKWLKPLETSYAGTKDKVVTTQLFALLQTRQADAIRNAERVAADKGAREYATNIAPSCTMVFLLVQRLLEIEADGGL